MIQTSLKLWTDDYEAAFILFNHNDFFDLALNSDHSIWLSGPAKCGKKHFAIYLSRFREVEMIFLDYLSDSQIVHIYDSLNVNHKFAVFVGNDLGDFSWDVKSRLGSLLDIHFSELPEDCFFEFLTLRLKRVGIFLDSFSLEYCRKRLPCSYFWIDSFVLYLKNEPIISLKTIRDFCSKV